MRDKIILADVSQSKADEAEKFLYNAAKVVCQRFIDNDMLYSIEELQEDLAAVNKVACIFGLEL